LLVITTMQPVQRQRLFCLTWTLSFNALCLGRTWEQKANDLGCCRPSEIDPSLVLVQQHYVIGFGDCADLLPTPIMWFGPLITPSCSGFTISQFGGIVS
jgi:hypothetical protein